MNKEKERTQLQTMKKLFPIIPTTAPSQIIDDSDEEELIPKLQTTRAIYKKS